MVDGVFFAVLFAIMLGEGYFLLIPVFSTALTRKMLMKTLKLAGKTIEVYDDIENLPVTRFHKYNKMLLVDAGIGSDIADFDRHISRIAAFLAKNDNKQAITELENIRQNVYFIQSGVSPRNLAFAVLVKSIDGKPCDDLSDEGLKKIVDMFADVPYKDLAASIEAVKKK